MGQVLSPVRGALTDRVRGLCAEDTRTVVSPDGQLEFRLFVAEPQRGDLPRIGYQVYNHGKRLMDTAFLGIDIRDQEPLLGENAGLIASSTGSSANHRYNWLIANYMQNGSLGRLLNIEIRAFDDGIAFRYVIPPSTPLDPIEIAGEATEFQKLEGVTITEVRQGSYPPMRRTLQRHGSSHPPGGNALSGSGPTHMPLASDRNRQEYGLP